MAGRSRRLGVTGMTALEAVSGAVRTGLLRPGSAAGMGRRWPGVGIDRGDSLAWERASNGAWRATRTWCGAASAAVRDRKGTSTRGGESQEGSG